MAWIQTNYGLNPKKNNGKIILTDKNNGLFFLVFKLEKFNNKTAKTYNKKFNFQIIN